MTESIFGFWNPTENTVKRFQVLHDALAKENARLELGICTLQNEFIQYRCSFDVRTLLNGWQPGVLGIAFFRPTPLFLPQYGVMSLYSIGDIAVACLGVIDNLPEIREKLISHGYQFYSKENAVETLSLLLHNYLEYHHLPFVKAIQLMMTKLKGRFAIMALVADGKWFMVGCCDYPLVMGKNRCHPTIYFGTDPETLAKFTPSMITIGGDKKQAIFYGTSLQFEIHLPDSVRWLTS
ncbi:MAG: hypothetical protein KAI83_14095 [Thiomargarita sp.]|nr:hypothetical protein [Thiomargarita sp.]